MKKIIITLLAVAVTWGPAFAAEEEAKPQGEEVANEEATEADDLARIEKYLNGISTMAADFTQVASDGALTNGKFYLKRPGMMRWQYEAPTPVLMIADGKQFVYYDYELEQVNYVPLDDAIMTFLTRAQVSLQDDKSVKVEKLEKTPGMLRMTLKQKDEPDAGTLTLEFSDEPLEIRKLVITDVQGATTLISLTNLRFGLKLSNKLFVFKDPRKPIKRL